jgi:hypothetical protein
MVGAAVLDHLLHRSVVFNIEGESYPKRSHCARTEDPNRGRSPGVKRRTFTGRSTGGYRWSLLANFGNLRHWQQCLANQSLQGRSKR